MSKKRWLAFVLLIIAVVTVVAGLIFYRGKHQPEPFTISVSDPPRFVNSPTVMLRGQVSRDSRLEFSRGTSTLATVYSRDKFEAEVELEPGENLIVVSAHAQEIEPAVVETDVLIVWEPKNPPVPTINWLPNTTNVPGITISGTSYPNAQIEVVITPESEEQERQAHYQKALKDGSFKTEVRLPAPGSYKITTAAYNFQNQKSAPSTELKVVYDPEWYPPSSPAQTLKARRITRKADIVLSHKQMIMTLEVKLPRDDPAVTTVLARQSSLSGFFEGIFGLEIHDASYFEFDEVVPQIVIKDQEATITATTLPHRAVRDFLPVLGGEFVVRGHRGFPFAGADDSLSISTYDYTIESIGPPPTQFEENKLTWKGSGARPLNSTDDILLFSQPTEEIKLQLAYKPLASPRNFLRLAQLSPYNAWRYPGNVVPHLLIGLFRLIPMLWVLWLVADSWLRNTIDPGLRKDLSKLSTTLITLSLTETVLLISAGLAFLGVRLVTLPDRSFSSIVLLQTVATVAVLLLATLVLLLTWRASNRSWAIWFARISRGMSKAAFICILLQLTWFVSFHSLLARATSIALILVTLGFLFWRLARVIRHGTPTPTHKYRLVCLGLIVLLTFVIPNIVPVLRTDVRANVFQSFSMLQSLLPYALVIGLLIVLKNVNALDQRRSRHVVLTIGLILFSGFVVGPTAHLFMVPVPFIISIILFRRFLIHDFATCGELDFVNNEVVSDRRGLIASVLSYETAQHFQANAEKLKDKVTSGDMTLKEFEERKTEIEKYARDKTLASTHENGLHAKTTVLGIGPHAEDWKNGRWCLRWAAALIAPFLVVYLMLLLLRPYSFSGTAFGFVFGLNQLLFFIADWLLSAFFFGYYFRYIRGNSGLEKGLRTALALIICLTPTWVTGISNNTELLGVLFGAAQTFLFFTLLGMLAFDYATFRNALRDQFRWRTFARFGNMPGFTAVVSVLVTSIGVGLTSVITGQFTELFTTLLSAAFQQAPGPPR
jgi:hypothetical protein